jgi:hypothetical protein|tara:strand:+ start:304 stop:633 length:330 start_codon:yes stop_codon:yes gene_type:complete
MFEDNYDDHEEDLDLGLTLSEKIALENLIIKTAFNNSFNVITKRRSFHDIIIGKDKDKVSTTALMAHDPYEDMCKEIYEDMIDYFLKEEEYEKCAELRDLMNKKEDVHV